MQYKTNRWSILGLKDSADYVKDMLRDSKYGGYYYKIITVAQAEEIKTFLNDPQNTQKKAAAIMTGIRSWNEQEVSYVRSNLGRGIVWYFRCNNCGRRAKLLYQYSETKSPLCRVCLGIDYRRRKTKRRERPGEYAYVVQKMEPTIKPPRKIGTAQIIRRTNKNMWGF